MNDFFCGIGKDIHNKIPNVAGNFKEYLTKNVNENFFLSAVTPAEVLKQLFNLNKKKTCGPDNLRPELIQY